MNIIKTLFLHHKRTEDHDPAVSSKSSGFHGRRINRVDLQVFLLTACIVIFSCSVMFFINYHLTYEGMVTDLRKRALNIHDFLDNRLEKSSFYELNKKEDDSHPIYADSKRTLEEVRNAAGVRYLYTAKENEQGEFIYLVDGLPSDSADFRYVNDPIEPECIADMKSALSGQTVLPENISETTWGSVFISYFPMHDDEKIIGVLGMEFDARQQSNILRQMRLSALIIILISCLAAAAFAVLMFRRISNPSFRDMANTDFLTGLKNRNAFEVDFSNLEKGAGKSKVAFISADLDKLKAVNDTFGHAAGDEYIRIGCQIISDTISSSGIVYRIGGDEFAVILMNATQEEVDKMIQEMKRREAEESALHDYHISFSAGYAFFDPEIDQTLSSTLRRADHNMYEQKKLKHRGLSDSNTPKTPATRS